MGCCVSHQASSEEDTHTVADTTVAVIPDDASSHNIAERSRRRLSRVNSASHPDSSHHDRSHHQQSLQQQDPTVSKAPNKPLKPLDPSQRCPLPNSETPTSTASRRGGSGNGNARPRHHHPVPLSLPADTPWTRKRLDLERQAFWDTRTNSRPEFWQAARMAVELLQQGETEEAQGILDAVGITCPKGEIWRGLFDERGEWLSVPDWVVLEPDGLVEEDTVVGSDSEDEVEKLAVDEEEVEKMGLNSGGRDKGKGKVSWAMVPPSSGVGSVVKVRCRMSNSGEDYLVKMGMEESLEILCWRLREITGLPTTQRIRLVYLGRTLHKHQLLSQTGWREGQVLNAFVFEAHSHS